MTTGPFTVIVNRRAGTVLAKGRSRIRAEIADAFAANGRSARIVFAAPHAIRDAIREAAEDESALPVVAGGDGTVSAAIDILAGTGRPLGILSLGTLNLFGRDLGIDGTLKQQIDALAAAEPMDVDLGRLNGSYFHSVSGTGFFAIMARERQRARTRFPRAKLLGFAFAAVRSTARLRRFDLTLDIDGEEIKREAMAVLVTNNRFAGGTWRRERLDGGVLQIHLMHPGALGARLRIGWDVIRGRWEQNPAIETFDAEKITISLRKRKRVTVATDGELDRLRGPLRYEITPRALRVLARHGAPD